MTRPLLTLEHNDHRAEVLVITSGWPNEQRKAYCVFIKRQVESLLELGVRCDVLFIRGYRSPLAYPLAALRLLRWSLSKNHHFRLVHAHGGEAAFVAACYRRAPLLVSYLGSDLLGSPRADGVDQPAEEREGGLAARVADVPNRALTDEAPVYNRPMQVPLWQKSVQETSFTELAPAPSPQKAFDQLIAVPTIASKRWAYRQFDHSVGTNTIAQPRDKRLDGR